jgi:hypothetical protein
MRVGVVGVVQHCVSALFQVATSHVNGIFAFSVNYFQ